MKVRLMVFIAAAWGVVLGEATPVPFVQPLQVSICRLPANPERFSGKEVIIRASIVHPRRLSGLFKAVAVRKTRAGARYEGALIPGLSAPVLEEMWTSGNFMRLRTVTTSS